MRVLRLKVCSISRFTIPQRISNFKTSWNVKRRVTQLGITSPLNEYKFNFKQTNKFNCVKRRLDFTLNPLCSMQFDCIQSLWNTKQPVLLLLLWRTPFTTLRKETREFSGFAVIICAFYAKQSMEICKWNWKLCAQEAVRLILIAIVHIKYMQRGEMFDTRYYIGEGLDAEGSSANDANYCQRLPFSSSALRIPCSHYASWFSLIFSCSLQAVPTHIELWTRYCSLCKQKHFFAACCLIDDFYRFATSEIREVLAGWLMAVWWRAYVPETLELIANYCPISVNGSART